MIFNLTFFVGIASLLVSKHYVVLENSEAHGEYLEETGNKENIDNKQNNSDNSSFYQESHVEN